MVKSIYTPLSGGLSQEKVLNIIANNLANLNTNGFKSENVNFEVLQSEPYKNYPSPLPPANYKLDLGEFIPPRGNDVQHVGVSGVYRDQSQGPAIETKNSTDLLIEGSGYFSVMTPDGLRYTRDGSFSLNTNGFLTDREGNMVQGERGAIPLRGQNFSVNARGEIYQDNEWIDTIQLVDFTNKDQLEKTGKNLYFFTGAPEETMEVANRQVRQGFVEGSNVNPIKNMTAMILAHRSFEAYQKAVGQFDSMMEKSSNVIGEVRA